jgi:hypothetical protein
MLRAVLDYLVAAVDRAEYLMTSLRLRILDQLAGPMPENPAEPVGETWGKRRQAKSVAAGKGLAALSDAGIADSSIQAEPSTLAAE